MCDPLTYADMVFNLQNQSMHRAQNQTNMLLQLDGQDVNLR